MNKTAIVTGASGAIGSAIVENYRDWGYKVVACGGMNAPTTEHKVIGTRADVADYEQVQVMVRAAIIALGSIDVLVNCAGIHGDATIRNLAVCEWKRVIAVNLTGVFNCTKAVLPTMKAQGRGSIINVSSVVGSSGVFGASNYAASKAGVEGFTRSAALEVARLGITVNALALGYFDAGMGERLPPSLKNDLIEAIPMRRFGRVREAVEAVAFLTTATYITGQVLHVNGGYYV